MSTHYEERTAAYIRLIEDGLDRLIPGTDCLQGDVMRAMRYSAQNGGKRVRPILTLEFARLCGLDEESALPFACAVEMIHTYSLIHDDLPCMDNDDMRRGNPSCHIQFGEDTALLAGDGLLTLAFEVMLRRSDSRKIPPRNILAAAGILAADAGVDGMMIAGGAKEQQEAAGLYAASLGLAFQIVDDILDVTSSTEVLGKPVGSDAENQKSTYVSLLGLDACRDAVRRLTDNAIRALAHFDGDTAYLAQLAEHLATRKS